MKKTQRAPGKRRMAREMAIQMLFQIDLGGCSPAAACAAFDLADYLRGDDGDEEGVRPRRVAGERLEEARRALEQARELVEGTIASTAEIDEILRSQAENWRVERMPAVDRNILRLAIHEMLHTPDVPKLVVLDEAVELAKLFGSENSSRFVNGLLDGLMRSHDLPGRVR